jgi:hypothetical protein
MRIVQWRVHLNGPLAQLAEQQTLNLRVLGSIPRRLTTNTFVFPRLLNADEADRKR